jgi:YYY domain-containing protein
MAPALGQALAWYVTLTAGGAAATGCLRRLGVGSGASWAVARLVGWTLAGYLAWIVGWAGMRQWWWAGLVAIAGLAWWGAKGWRHAEFRALVEPEVVGVATFLLLAFLRFPALAVTGTEKPMDLAILATLLRPGSIPPVDPWLAGHSLAYYYWGFVPWLLPAKLCGFAPDQIFNLLVPTLAALSAQAGWALARVLGGSRRSAVMAGFLVVFAGTFDGWRQLVAGASLRNLDLWASSRVIKGAITEFPLFTFHLGDLHPHLLCIPLVLTAIFLARVVGHVETHRYALALVGAVVYGAAAAANPWCAVPVGGAIWLVALAEQDGFVNFTGEGRRRWALVVGLGAVGWALFVPFWLNFHPPAQGFGWVGSGTRGDELFVFLGAILVPACLVGWELARRLGGVASARRQFVRAGWLAATVVLAAATQRPALGLAVGLGTLLVIAVLGGRARPARPSFALASVALALLAFMEVVFVKDPYGDEFYRMNTVFKTSSLAFILLAVTAPVLLGWLRRRRPLLAVIGTLVVGFSVLPQLATLVGRALPASGMSWDGLRWMAPGESAAAAFLRSLPARSVLVEGIGEAYSDAARMSAASGVPTVLGWSNHESVWRGATIGEELVERQAQVERLFRCGSETLVRRIAGELGAGYVVVGSVERRLYPPTGLAAVERAGRVAFRSDQCLVVAVGS